MILLKRFDCILLYTHNWRDLQEICQEKLGYRTVNFTIVLLFNADSIKGRAANQQGDH